MLSIKNEASLIAPLRVLLRFKKKLTFMGIIGNTQGVINAVKPKPMPFKNISHQDVFSSLAGGASVFASISAVALCALAFCITVSFAGKVAVFVFVSADVFMSAPVFACSILSENFLAGGKVHISSVQV